MLSHYEEESSSGDSDSGLDEDMEALRRACSITGVGDSVDAFPESSTPDSDDDAAYASEDEDIELLRSLQQRFSVPSADIGTEQHPIFMKPLNIILPYSSSDENDDYGDDFETLRAIQRRFSQYNDSMNNSIESSSQKSEQVGPVNIELEKESSSKFFVERINHGQGFPDCVDRRATTQTSDNSSNITPDTPQATDTRQSYVREGHEPGSEIVPVTDCGGFPRSAQAFVEAIKKNRTYQKFIRNQLAQMEAKMEENRKLKERVKILRDFQVACRKRTGRALSQKKDPRIQLISILKPRANAKDKNIPAYQGPAENSHVAIYRKAMSTYPFSLSREPWSKEEKGNLLKGITQQFQEMLVKNLLSAGDLGDLDSMTQKIRDHEISPEEIREFLPKIKWEDLSSMYLPGRSGPECRSRWINCEDPLINHEPWKPHEDKKILYIFQNEKHCVWIDLANKLGTNRTPFQCLSRFQRSLNASIIKNEWTPSEDAELRNAVAEYGESNWQLIASTLEGRTGSQCSNRWMKSLNPLRERVGKWAPDEDMHLKIAARLFGAKNWNKISSFVRGRTQVQCRERWVNCLDPSLNMDKWTQEEDQKLKAAISEHGYCWSRIAACIPPRTDSQCRRRWKVLLPHEVPMLEAARQVKRAAFISNFVDREAERPHLTLNDFIAPLQIQSEVHTQKNRKQKMRQKKSEHDSSSVHQDNDFIAPLQIEPEVHTQKNRKQKMRQKESEHDSSSVHQDKEAHSPKEPKRKMPPKQCGRDSSSGSVFKVRSRRARKVTCTEKVMHLIDEDDVMDDGGDAEFPGDGILLLQNTPFTSCEGTVLMEDSNNVEGDGMSGRDGLHMKKKTIRKRKPKSNSSRRATEKRATENVIDEDVDGRRDGELENNQHSLINNPITSHGGTVILDSNNDQGDGTSGRAAVDLIKETTGKRKWKQERGGNKEQLQQIDETLEPNDISNLETLTPCSISDSQLHEDAEVTLLTNETSKTDPCSSLSPHPSKTKRKREEGGVGMLVNEPCSSQQVTESTPQVNVNVNEPNENVKSSKTPGDKDKQILEEVDVDDDETLGTFLDRLKKRRLERRG